MSLFISFVSWILLLIVIHKILMLETLLGTNSIKNLSKNDQGNLF